MVVRTRPQVQPVLEPRDLLAGVLVAMSNDAADVDHGPFEGWAESFATTTAYAMAAVEARRSSIAGLPHFLQSS